MGNSAERRLAAPSSPQRSRTRDSGRSRRYIRGRQRRSLRCRRPRTRRPTSGRWSSRSTASPLRQQLRELPNLKVIVALGKVAGHALLGITEKSIPPKAQASVAWMREHCRAEPIGGQPYSAAAATPPTSWKDLPHAPSTWPLIERGVKVFCTYHPAYLLRKPLDRKAHAEVWADLKLATEALR